MLIPLCVAKIISFQGSSQTVAESTGVVELRLVADNVFEEEQFIHLSAEDGTTNSETECMVVCSIIVWVTHPFAPPLQMTCAFLKLMVRSRFIYIVIMIII